MTVDDVSSYEDLLSVIRTGTYDVIVLDRLLKGQDSLESLPAIRRYAPLAQVLVLSALKEVEDKVKGLSEGADDYLGKPFHVTELIARIRALIRRTTSSGRNHNILVYQDIKIELDTQKVFRGTQKIELTGKEFKILCLLARHPGQVFSRIQILDRVWDMHHDPGTNIVEVTIANLRAKLDKESTALIQSRRGVGYWLGEA